MRAKHYGKAFPKHGGQTQHSISREFLTSLCAQAALVESVHKEMDLNTVRVLVDLYWILSCTLPSKQALSIVRVQHCWTELSSICKHSTWAKETRLVLFFSFPQDIHTKLNASYLTWHQTRLDLKQHLPMWKKYISQIDPITLYPGLNWYFIYKVGLFYIFLIFLSQCSFREKETHFFSSLFSPSFHNLQVSHKCVTSRRS